MEIKVLENQKDNSYRIIIEDDIKVLESINASLQNYLTEELETIEDFWIADYLMYQDEIDVEDYYGSVLNDEVSFEDALEYAGRLTSFEFGVDRLVLTIEDAKLAYDSQMIKDFFFNSNS